MKIGIWLLVLMLLVVPSALAIIDSSGFQPIYGNTTATFNRVNVSGTASYHANIDIFNTTNGILVQLKDASANCVFSEAPQYLGAVWFNVTPPANHTGFNMSMVVTMSESEAIGFYFGNRSIVADDLVNSPNPNIGSWYGGWEKQYDRFRIYKLIDKTRTYTDVNEGSGKDGAVLIYLNVTSNGTHLRPQLYYNGTQAYSGWDGGLSFAGNGYFNQTMDMGIAVWMDNNCPTTNNATINDMKVMWYGGSEAPPAGPITNYSVSWYSNTTNVTAYNYTDVGSFSINWTSGNATGKTVSYSIFSSNNTGTWANATAQAANGNYSYIFTDVLTLNQSQANLTLGYKWFGNSSDDLWNVTDIFILTKSNYTASYAPSWFNDVNNLSGTYSYGTPLQFWMNWSMPDTAGANLAYFIFSTNNSGTWVNETMAFTSNKTENVSFNLSAGHYFTIGYKWYANSTDGLWNVSTANTLTGFWAPQFYDYSQNATQIKKGGTVYTYTNATDQYNLSCQIWSLLAPNASGNWVNETTVCNTTQFVCISNWNDCKGIPTTKTFEWAGVWQWKWYMNNSNNQFNVSPALSLTVNETYAPIYSNNGSNASVVRNNSVVKLYQYWTMPNLSATAAISHIIFSTNNTGSWVNDTPTSISNQSVNFTKNLVVYAPGYTNRTIGYKWFANSTDVLWNSTPEYILTRTPESWTLITNCTELMAVSSSLGVEYGLANDIDCGEVSFQPIPNFRGILHGNNFTIKNINFTVPYQPGTNISDIGIFKHFDNATVTNLILSNVSFNCYWTDTNDCLDVGGLVGHVGADCHDGLNGDYTTTISQVAYKNGYINSVKGTSSGGLVGAMNGGCTLTITDSYIYGSHTGGGGLVGYMANAGELTIYDSYCANSDVTSGLLAYSQKQFAGSGYYDNLYVGGSSNSFTDCTVTDAILGNYDRTWGDGDTYYARGLTNVDPTKDSTLVNLTLNPNYFTNATKFNVSPMNTWSTSIWRLNRTGEYPAFLWEAYSPDVSPVGAFIYGNSQYPSLILALGDTLNVSFGFTDTTYNLSQWMLNEQFPNGTWRNYTWTSFTAGCGLNCNASTTGETSPVGTHIVRILASNIQGYQGYSNNLTVLVYNSTPSGGYSSNFFLGSNYFTEGLLYWFGIFNPQVSSNISEIPLTTAETFTINSFPFIFDDKVWFYGDARLDGRLWAVNLTKGYQTSSSPYAALALSGNAKKEVDRVDRNFTHTYFQKSAVTAVIYDANLTQWYARMFSIEDEPYVTSAMTNEIWYNYQQDPGNTTTSKIVKANLTLLDHADGQVRAGCQYDTCLVAWSTQGHIAADNVQNNTLYGMMYYPAGSTNSSTYTLATGNTTCFPKYGEIYSIDYDNDSVYEFAVPYIHMRGATDGGNQYVVAFVDTSGTVEARYNFSWYYHPFLCTLDLDYCNSGDYSDFTSTGSGGWASCEDNPLGSSVNNPLYSWASAGMSNVVFMATTKKMGDAGTDTYDLAFAVKINNKNGDEWHTDKWKILYCRYPYDSCEWDNSDNEGNLSNVFRANIWNTGFKDVCAVGYGANNTKGIYLTCMTNWNGTYYSQTFTDEDLLITRHSPDIDSYQGLASAVEYNQNVSDANMSEILTPYGIFYLKNRDRASWLGGGTATTDIDFTGYWDTNVVVQPYSTIYSPYVDSIVYQDENGVVGVLDTNAVDYGSVLNYWKVQPCVYATEMGGWVYWTNGSDISIWMRGVMNMSDPLLSGTTMTYTARYFYINGSGYTLSDSATGSYANNATALFNFTMPQSVPAANNYTNDTWGTFYLWVGPLANMTLNASSGFEFRMAMQENCTVKNGTLQCVSGDICSNTIGFNATHAYNETTGNETIWQDTLNKYVAFSNVDKTIFWIIIMVIISGVIFVMVKDMAMKMIVMLLTDLVLTFLGYMWGMMSIWLTGMIVVLLVVIGALVIQKKMGGGR